MSKKALSGAWPKDIAPLAIETIDAARLTLADLYTGVAAHYPLATFSQFYGLTRGDTATAANWSAQMQASIAVLKGANPNFVAYTAPGSQHCIINSPGFYTTTVNGVRLVDWVGRLLSARPPASVP